MLKSTVEKIIRGFADNKKHTLSINFLRFQPEEAEFLEDCLLIKPLRDCNFPSVYQRFIDYEMIDQIDVRNNISITFKTPDAVDFATEDLDASEKEAAREALKKWISYGEYVTLSYDPNNDTMTVQKR